MKLRLIRHLWGVAGDPMPLFDHWSEVGYRGLEIPITMMNADALAEAKRRHWSVIMQIFSDQWNYSHNVDVHVASFSQQLNQALELGADTINCHGGEDAFSDAQAVEYFGRCEDLAKQAGAQVVWETHRGRALFHPWKTQLITQEYPDLQLCLDLSHWTCVCERLLNDIDDVLEDFLPRVGHIHARIGSKEAPQVADPSAPECAEELAWFDKWWLAVWRAHKAAGRDELTVCPEFGPPPYLPCLPHTRAPVVDLATVCDWTARHLQQLLRE